MEDDIFSVRNMFFSLMVRYVSASDVHRRRCKPGCVVNKKACCPEEADVILCTIVHESCMAKVWCDEGVNVSDGGLGKLSVEGYCQ
ncbi:MAG: hypothetical protein LBH04_07790 [Tannerellaceae bacterium]|jgi:hypothetical protein|nr:hypothetical protein [Tannerellaceae bacterium]